MHFDSRVLHNSNNNPLKFISTLTQLFVSSSYNLPPTVTFKNQLEHLNEKQQARIATLTASSTLDLNYRFLHHEEPLALPPTTAYV